MGDPPTELLHGLARLVLRALAEVDGCAIALVCEGTPVTVARSGTTTADPPGTDDPRPHPGGTAGTGPGAEALAGGVAVESADLANEGRWGPFPAAALRVGVHQLLVIPLPIGVPGVEPRVSGTLTLCSATAHHLTDSVRAAGTEFAAIAAGVVGGSDRLGGGHAEPGTVHPSLHVRAMLARRRDVEGAVGRLMELNACDSAAGFALLRDTSRAGDEQVHITAARIVAAGVPRLRGRD